MVQTVNTLDWKAFGDGGAAYVASYLLDGLVDQNYVFRTAAAAVQSSPNGQNISAVWITVDNSSNDGNVSIAYSGVFWVVPAFARQSFKLPSNSTDAVFVLANLGQCQLFFSNVKLVDDEINRFAIAQYTGSGALFPYETKIASAVQLTTDINKVIHFVALTDVTYTLLNISANGMPNGWYQVIRNGGAGLVTLVPSGGDQINLKNEIIIKPGQTAILSSDSVAWFARGEYKARGEVIQVVDFEATPTDFVQFTDIDYDFIIHMEGIYTSADTSVNGRFSVDNGVTPYAVANQAGAYHWHWYHPGGQGVGRTRNQGLDSVDFIREHELRGGLNTLPLCGEVKFMNCHKPRLTLWQGQVMYAGNNANVDITYGNLQGYVNNISVFNAFSFYTAGSSINFTAGRLTLEKIYNKLEDF